MESDLAERNQRRIDCYNSSGEEIPAFSVARIVSVDEDGILTIAKPNANSQETVVFTYEAPIPIGAYGLCTIDLPAEAVYDSGDGTPALGEAWGAEASSWKLNKTRTGFTVLGIPDSTVERVLVQRASAASASVGPGTANYLTIFATSTTLGDAYAFQSGNVTVIPNQFAWGRTKLIPTVDQNDYSVGNYTEVQIDASDSIDITGLASGYAGRVLWLHNIDGAFTITLKHQSGSSSAANRILTSSGQDYILEPGCDVWLYYDDTESRWRVADAPLPVHLGGTGLRTVATGGLLSGDGTSDLVVISPGADGTYLKGTSGSTAPTFGTIDLADLGTGTPDGTKALHGDGTWKAADHAQLTNLAWTSSGHTGTADRFPHFSGAGAAEYVAETGSGNVVRATSPTVTTPVIAEVRGGTGSGETLTLVGTTHATKGGVRLGDGEHLRFQEISAPGTPATGYVILYAKSDGSLYSKDDAGTETVVTGGGSSTAASQAEMEAASSTAVYASPGRTQYHPGVCKGWVRFNSSATIAASHNVSSITDSGLGSFTVVWDTDFSSGNYCVLGTSEDASGVEAVVVMRSDSTPAAGSVAIYVVDLLGTQVLYDASLISVAAFGDQA